MKVSVELDIVETKINDMVEVEIPDEVCSNTDVIGVDEWCVAVPDASVELFAQLCGELCFLALIFFTSYRYFIWRKRVTLEKEMLMSTNDDYRKEP